MKTPFVEGYRVPEASSCNFGDEEMVYDVWLGLKEVCFCQEGSSLNSVYG